MIQDIRENGLELQLPGFGEAKILHQREVQILGWWPGKLIGSGIPKPSDIGRVGANRRAWGAAWNRKRTGVEPIVDVLI